MFSISDKLYGYMRLGYIVNVRILGSTKMLSIKDKYVFKEEVPSKFSNGVNWHRYWYKKNGHAVGQMTIKEMDRTLLTCIGWICYRTQN